MTAQPLFQFGTVTLNPAPDRRVIGLQTALGEQLLDIAERQRVPKIPAHGTKNQLRRRLPPLEDCRSGCVLHDLFTLPATPAKVATHPIFFMSRQIWNYLCRLRNRKETSETIEHRVVTMPATLRRQAKKLQRLQGSRNYEQ